MSFKNVFIGSPQSKYAAFAIILAIVCVSISILFGKESMPIGQKIGAIFLLVLVSVPGILYSLFQITCLETGAGSQNQRWWCSLYAWLITAVVIIYSVLLVAVAVLSVLTGKGMTQDIEHFTDENFNSAMTTANTLAEYAQNKFTSGGLPVNQFNNNTGSAHVQNNEYFDDQQQMQQHPEQFYDEQQHPEQFYDEKQPEQFYDEKQPEQFYDEKQPEQFYDEQQHPENFRGYSQSGQVIHTTETPEPYPFLSDNSGHGWAPLNSIDLPPGA